MFSNENKTYIQTQQNTYNNKPKRRYQISKPSYLISESSNVIIQAIEAKMKANKIKAPTPQLYSTKSINKHKANTQLKKVAKAKSYKVLPQSATTNASPKIKQGQKAIITVKKPVLYSKVNVSKTTKENNAEKSKPLTTLLSTLKQNKRKNAKIKQINAINNKTNYDSNRLMTTSCSNSNANTYANANMNTHPNSNTKSNNKNRTIKPNKCRTPNCKLKINMISVPVSTKIKKQRNSINASNHLYTISNLNNISTPTLDKQFKPYQNDKLNSNSPENKKKILVSIAEKVGSPIMSSKFKDYHGFKYFNKKKKFKTRQHLHANSEIIVQNKADISTLSNNSFNIVQYSSVISPKSKTKISLPSDNNSNEHSGVYYENNIAYTSPNTLTLSTNTIRSNLINKKIAKIDFYSKPGLSSSAIEKVNQDNYFITQNFLNEPEQYLLGVCDGHGISGHLASEFIVNNLPEILLDIFSEKKPSVDNHTKIRKAYAKLNTDLIESNDIDSRYSGTTCISTIISKDKIVCSNLGDSRAVLAVYDKGTWNTINLSRDHTALVTSERNRILQKGGRIAAYIDEFTHENLGPERVWLQEADLPGLAMTRSFGDQIAHCVGVTCEPEIKDYYYNGTERFIILASDGIWQFIDGLECIYLIKDFYLKGDVSGACYAIVEEAFSRWLDKKEAVDDITVIIAFFE